MHAVSAVRRPAAALAATLAAALAVVGPAPRTAYSI